MKLCVVSFKNCWRDATGTWFSYGGFPMQMSAIGSLFDEMTLLIVEVPPRQGGMPLPAYASIVPLRQPIGQDARRKLSVLRHLPYYFGAILKNESQADAVHVPLPADISFLGLLAALGLRKRLIARFGGSWTPTSETTAMDALTRAIMRRFAGGRNVMLATGIGDEPPAADVHWLFATALGQQEVASVRPNLDRQPGNPMRLVYMGRLSPEKGVRQLIESLSITRGILKAQDGLARLPRLMIIGDGPQRSQLEALVEKHHLKEQVCFAGQLDRSELISHLLISDLCVLPSLTESFCKARLDAMLCGVPVVTTEVGFGREIVGKDGERGWIAPPDNAQSLAWSLKGVLEEPIDWPALRRRCRSYAEQYTLETWSQWIGEICARQWGLRLVEGKLKA